MFLQPCPSPVTVFIVRVSFWFTRVHHWLQAAGTMPVFTAVPQYPEQGAVGWLGEWNSSEHLVTRVPRTVLSALWSFIHQSILL